MSDQNIKYKVLLVDDHNIVRDGLRALLRGQRHLKIVAEAENGYQALETLAKKEVDLVLIDINMPEMNGIECTEQITKKYPDIRVLALTMMKEEQHIRQMLKAGASGYILKDAGKEELLRGINTVIEGKSYFSSEASQVMMMDLMGGKSSKRSKVTPSELIYLTGRERDVLKLIVKEMTNQEIAKELYISTRTVDAHRRSLLQKIGARNSVGLVKYALEHNLLED